MLLRFHTAADEAEQDCLDKYLNLSEKSFPDGTSCLCAQRPAVMADDATQMASQGLKKACRDNASAEPEVKSSVLLSVQPENFKQPAVRIPVSSSAIKEESEEVGTAGREVGEQSSLTSCVQAAKTVDVGKEDSVDADKACAAIASPSEPADTTTGDEQKKKPQQQEKTKRDPELAVCSLMGHVSSNVSQLPFSLQLLFLFSLLPQLGTAWGLVTMAMVLVLIGGTCRDNVTILERRESKMSAYDVPGDKNAMKLKMARKCLQNPRWVGGSWGTELAAAHKLAIHDVFERRRNVATVTGNAVRERKQCFKPADSMPARRRNPKEEGSLWVPCLLLLAAAALMLLVPPQMATEARVSSNNRLPALGRAPSFVFTGYPASDLAISLQACNPRPMAKPSGATGSFESVAASARAPISKDVPCTTYVKADVSSSTQKPRVHGAGSAPRKAQVLDAGRCWMMEGVGWQGLRALPGRQGRRNLGVLLISVGTVKASCAGSRKQVETRLDWRAPLGSSADLVIVCGS